MTDSHLYQIDFRSSTKLRVYKITYWNYIEKYIEITTPSNLTDDTSVFMAFDESLKQLYFATPDTVWVYNEDLTE